MNLTSLTFCLSFIGFSAIAQVGINTTTPTETLDVNGTVRVRTMADIPPSLNGGDKFLYIKPDGTFGKVGIGSAVVTTNGDIEINTGGNATTTRVVAVDLPNGVDNIDNLDLELDGANSDASIIILQGGSEDIDIRGIIGGTEGRRIYLVNNTGDDIRLRETNSGAVPPGNRFRRFTEHDELKDGGSNHGGTAELVWTTQGVGLTEGRWVMLSLDRGRD
jgi:hypothetical protein